MKCLKQLQLEAVRTWKWIKRYEWCFCVSDFPVATETNQMYWASEQLLILVFVTDLNWECPFLLLLLTYKSMYVTDRISMKRLKASRRENKTNVALSGHESKGVTALFYFIFHFILWQSPPHTYTQYLCCFPPLAALYKLLLSSDGLRLLINSEGPSRKGADRSTALQLHQSCQQLWAHAAA